MRCKAHDIFQDYGQNRYEPALKNMKGTYLFDIDQVGSWYVSVDNGSVKIEQARRKAECVIRCSEDDFVDIVEGRRNLITAAMQGRVQISGDVALALKFRGFVGASVESNRGTR